MASKMTVYRVVAQGKKWAINHDGNLEGSYSTKEAAFEAAIGPASNSIKDGVGITIEVPSPAPGEVALGNE